jgi:hypothetical protein
MSDKQIVLSLLEQSHKFRERKNKNRGLVYLLTKKHPAIKEIEPDILVELVKDYSGMDRWWRKHLEENPNLRGSDYGQAEELEQEKQIELGYEVGHKNLSKII